MADPDSGTETKNFHLDTPQRSEPFFLKGSGSLDWGMKNRLARIFDARSGKTVMLAIDHGYFQGPTTGLERVDVDIVPLLAYADTLMLTRGILRERISGAIRSTRKLTNPTSPGTPVVVEPRSARLIRCRASSSCRAWAHCVPGRT